MEKLQEAGRRLWEDIYNLRFALLGIAAYYLLVHFLFGQFCPMMILLHFPCPGCGMTRALLLVLHGHWAEAWHLQPLIFGWIFLAAWFIANRYLFNRKTRLLKGMLVLLLFGTICLYIWRLLHGFPVALLKS